MIRLCEEGVITWEDLSDFSPDLLDTLQFLSRDPKKDTENE